MKPEQLKQIITIVVEGLEEKIDKLSGEISTVKKTIPNVDRVLSKLKVRTPQYGKDWKLTREEIEQIAEKIKPIAGRDFEPPKDGKDAEITDELIMRIAKMVQATVKNGRDGRDGIDGIDGKDGKDGRDGMDADPDDLVGMINLSELQIDLERVNTERIDTELRNLRANVQMGMQSLPITTSFINGRRAKNFNFVGVTPTHDGDTATIDLSGISGGTPASPDTSVQFNDGGVFGGDSAFTWNKTDNKLTVNTIDIFSPATNSLIIGGNAGSNITEQEITGVGFGNLALLSTGLRHSAFGYNAGNTVTNGNGCTFMGHDADASFGSIEGAIALGSGALVEASHSMVVGGSVDYIDTVIIGNGVSAASPQDLTISSTKGIGTNVQGADLVISLGASTGNAVSGAFKVQVSDVSAVSGTSSQSKVTVFTATSTSSSGAFTSWGDPDETNNKTKIAINDANETIDMELDGNFTIADTGATTNRVFIANPTGNQVTMGDFDDVANSGLLDINDDIHTHYATTLYVKAPPSPTGGVAFQVDTGTNPTIQMGDIGLNGNSVRFIVADGIQQVYVDKALFWVARGTDTASANDILLPFDGNLIHITGTTTIKRLSVPYPNNASVYGTEITLVLDSNIIIEHGETADATYSGIFLAGSVDWSAPAASRIKLYYDNGYWYEISRTSP